MKRTHPIEAINTNFDVHPITAILGPRQCGKTTLAKMYAKTQSNTDIYHFDLEDPTDRSKLDNPKLALENLDGLIIIDEIQLSPDLFPYLRVLVDKHPKRRILILGSASRELIKQPSETLAGRIGYLELTPFNFSETQDMQQLWLRGGFPKAYLANTLSSSMLWRKNYITTFLEQDIPKLGINIPANNLRRFWLMISHYHSNILNASEIGRSLNLSNVTIQKYLDILSGTFMIRQLSPWFTNLKKRHVKSPKIYFRDSGILHTMLGIEKQIDLNNHPKLGASWEGFALEEIIRHHQATPEECYFWSLHSGAELDLLIVKDGKHHGFEFKFTDKPKVTASMRSALENLELDSLTVIFPGNESFKLTEEINAAGLENYLSQN